MAANGGKQKIASGLEEHHYVPPEIDTLDPGDGNFVIAGYWRHDNGVIGKVVGITMTKKTAEEVARRILSPSIEVAREIPKP